MLCSGEHDPRARRPGAVRLMALTLADGGGKHASGPCRAFSVCSFGDLCCTVHPCSCSSHGKSIGNSDVPVSSSRCFPVLLSLAPCCLWKFRLPAWYLMSCSGPAQRCLGDSWLCWGSDPILPSLGQLPGTLWSSRFHVTSPPRLWLCVMGNFRMGTGI